MVKIIIKLFGAFKSPKWSNIYKMIPILEIVGFFCAVGCAIIVD